MHLKVNDGSEKATNQQPPTLQEGTDSFWSELDQLEDNSQDNPVSTEREIHMWGGLSSPSRSANPIHVMKYLKRDYPLIYRLFRKYSIFPATQNKDERLFSLVGRNTGPLSRRIKIETIEKKVVVGSAIQKHGFIFDHQKGHESSSTSSDDSVVV